ncbi:hypothetical protein OEZ85_008439 [Tetradesmus obliquus]|uniref:non-specific serine/threonine protein kinase n=1 Tax=Tetradesmus obliquus TaxID=3088 RepID=A0ABY8TJ25_TETOB|nr:hypothetical protein OEZ85_008439 [Tetradesmus obliquus]
MAAAQPYLDLDFEEEQWEEQSEPYDEVSEASDADASPNSHINAETETDQDDPDSDTVSSGLCGGPEPPQDNLKLRFSAGTADLNGHGAVHEQLPAGTIIDRCYKITGIVGKGSFGAAYAAEHLNSGLQVVIKARVSTSGTNFSDSVRGELNVYMGLNAQGQMEGIPCLYSAGVHKLSPSSASSGRKTVYVSYLVIQRLGPSIWTSCHRQHGPQQLTWRPSKQDMFNIASGMLKALAAIHSKGFMHKDVKTDNFCMSKEHRTTSIYAIDYGFSRPAFGTPNYASLNSLLRTPQTPRDDLEALVYCLFELEQDDCRVPWNLTTNAEAAAGWTDEQLARMNKSKWAAWQEACHEGCVPPYLMDYFSYITDLEACHCPDYKYLLGLVQCGINGHPLPSMPTPKVFRAWPAPDEQFDHQEVTELLLHELHAAASAVLPEAPSAAISTELQLQLDVQQDEELPAAGKQQPQRYAAEVQAPAPVDAAGAFTCAFHGDALWLSGEDGISSDAVQRFKRQRITDAAACVGMFGPGPNGAWPAAVGVIPNSQSQPEE